MKTEWGLSNNQHCFESYLVRNNKKGKNFGVSVGVPKTAYYIHIINILILKYSYILHLLGTYFTNFHISSVLPTKHICSAVEYGNAKHLAASKIVIVFTSRLRHSGIGEFKKCWNFGIILF